MKKLTSIVLVLSLVMCLFAGCSSTKPAETTAVAAPAAEIWLSLCRASTNSGCHSSSGCFA